MILILRFCHELILTKSLPPSHVMVVNFVYQTVTRAVNQRMLMVVLASVSRKQLNVFLSTSGSFSYCFTISKDAYKMSVTMLC